MVDELKSLVIQQLRVVFPQVKKVYDEPVQQGLQVPAFLVLIINDIQERKLNRRMVQEFTFNITYFPSDERMFYTESDQVSFQFKTNFRYIANKFHVFNIEAIKHDRTLIFTFTVKTTLEEIVEEVKMRTLEVQQIV
ncbi:DUF6838 family protein [Psychrobacillus sp. FJAT-21963]|uniref:phage tail terminator family protein n=1 Tax=Psychrobacillus sp. FJAT-21963 TaxID=1712028 RepID=UPI000700E662|nr:hypothetical protein [Psychrobacillus sp. FJAT-21963]KQL37128.1 hypothetical protein AN959_03560 [Psychrobacillus sp. FJAT-21963]